MGLEALIPSLLGGAAQLFGANQANKASAEAAQKQMDFQERMASTQYQRGVADMKAAGLNPMLAYMSGGDSSAQGAMAQVQNPEAGFAQLGASITSSALSLSSLKSEIAKNLEQAGVFASQTDLNEFQKLVSQEQRRILQLQEQGMTADLALKEAVASVVNEHPKFFGWANALSELVFKGSSSAFNLGKLVQ